MSTNRTPPDYAEALVHQVQGPAEARVLRGDFAHCIDYPRQ
ncbi:MAG: hypothetical protein ACRDTC_26630 [Pseudonocardiaceae bacterium]